MSAALGPNYDLLVAETEAFPFAAPASLRLGTLRLSRPNYIEDAPTAALSEALTVRLRSHAAGLPLESLTQLQRRLWFRETETEEQLLPLLERVASQYLELHGARAVLKSDSCEAGVQLRGRGPELAARFRWLTLRMPADLLLAALTFRLPKPLPTHHISIQTALLDALLERPMAETHLHLGNAVRFDLLWTALMAQVGSGHTVDALAMRADVSPLPWHQHGATGTDRAKWFKGEIAAAGALRWVLARVLHAGYETRSMPSWHHERHDRRALAHEEEAAEAERKQRAALGLPPLARRRDDVLRRERLDEADAETLDDLVESALAYGDAPRPSWARLVVLARTLMPRNVDEAALDRARARAAQDRPKGLFYGPFGALRRCDALSDVVQKDPIFDLGPPEFDETLLPEQWLTHWGLRRVEREPNGDFAAVFWHYQKLRNLVYDHITQDPGVGGLDWFQRYFNRLRAVRRGLDPVIFEVAHKVETARCNLDSLEVRTSPAASWGDNFKLLRELDTFRRRKAGRLEVAVVLHFLKDRHEEVTGRLHADPEPWGWSYAQWARERERELVTIETALEAPGRDLSLVLRGLDVASTELAIPTWPLIPLFARAREVSQRAAERLHARHPKRKAPPMRTTIHAGEDYRRLAEGLRRIDELITFGVLRNGDRIGHGLALGDDPARWAASAQRVTQPRNERLMDLLWEFGQYAGASIPSDHQRVEYVRAEAERLGKAMFSEHLSVAELSHLRVRLHDPTELARLGFPDSPLASTDDRLVRYLRDADVFARGLEGIEVETTPTEVAFLCEMQRLLRGHLARMEITIESNPSSNLLIGNFGDLIDHPIFRLQPLPGQEPVGGPAVHVSLNSDDPLTFATCLSDEYAHLYLALQRRGVSSQDALAWLDRLRQYGWNSRFSVPVSLPRQRG